MIHVEEQPEPKSFEKRVRSFGNKFLKTNPTPKTWKKKDYWRHALNDLHSAYKGICCYSAHWIACDTGVASVDHFVPKSTSPSLAYEWSNYRLASLKLNAFKFTAIDVLDPFLIEDGWFILNFPSLLIKPNPNCNQDQQHKIELTIARLRLNHEEPCIRARLDWLMPYCNKEISFTHLQKRAPFIAHELKRQNLLETIGQVMHIN